jgi:hypothetical protein
MKTAFPDPSQKTSKAAKEHTERKAGAPFLPFCGLTWIFHTRCDV